MSASRPPRSPLALAALACASVVGLEPVTVRDLDHPDVDIDAALVVDTIDRQWVVRSPRSTAAGARMDAESKLVEVLFGWVSFGVPRVAGSAPLPEGGRALVYRAVGGAPLQPAMLTTVPTLASAVGRALATVHDLPTRLVADAGLPVYEAEEYRERRLAEVDRAAATGHVPPSLLSRWEKALEEAGAWRFVPAVVHGDLDGDTLRVEGTQLAGIIDWAQARVADPADDFAWLANAVDSSAFESVMATYTLRRRTTPDAALVRRARLAGELSLVRWLLHGTSTDDASVVDDAVGMLTALEESLAGSMTW
ncbi:MAG: phosphotransferase [Kineosporiaceae bacterium]